MKKFKVLFVSVFLLFITEYEIKEEKEVKEEDEESNGNSIEDWEVDADSTVYELKPSGKG